VRNPPVPRQPVESLAALHFGDGRFILEPTERRLFVDGKPASIGSRALDLLIALATQPDHLLTKTELLDLVWPGLVVEEANLQMQVSNLRKLLGPEAIATVPGRGYRFVAMVVPVPGPAAAAALRPAGSAPAAPALAPAPAAATAQPKQRLIGRDADRAALQTMLATPGCVTLVGTAGVGKTSLARQVAADRTERSAFVDLASLSRGDEVPDAVARALAMQLEDGDRVEQIVRALATDSPLLVLDNAEHLVQAVAELAGRLTKLQSVRLLVTSQLPLDIAGERCWRLLPLALPSGAGAARSAGEDAVALLIDRIVSADRRFEATAANLPQLEAICTQLDGLPLALEMAAARVPAMGLSAVHDALSERFAMLTRGHRDATTRHRTLHHALDWSYRLLDAPEQRVFRMLGVFAAGFTLELAVALLLDRDPGAGARWEVIDRLSALIDRSLLVASADDPPRYHLLETMRAFAVEQLVLSGEAPAAREREARELLALLERFGAMGRVVGDSETTALCAAEMGNVRDAIGWARQHDFELAVRLTTQASFATAFSLWRQESTRWLLALEPVMDAPAGRRLPVDAQAFYWSELARKLMIRSDPRASVPARRGYELWLLLDRPAATISAAASWVRSLAAAGDELDAAVHALDTQLAHAPPDLSPRLRLNVQGARAVASELSGDFAALLAAREAEVALARELGLAEAEVAAGSNVLYALNALRRHDEALRQGQALLARVDAADGDRNASLPWILEYVIQPLAELGRLDEAHALLGRLLRVLEEWAEPPAPWLPLMTLLAAQRGRAAEAALLLGRMGHDVAARQVSYSAPALRNVERARAAAVSALGEAEVRRLMSAGEGLDDNEMRAVAMR
jgi:predicted ATPase/DNA-binding winged helix-turn-helix (wHTH) protein